MRRLDSLRSPTPAQIARLSLLAAVALPPALVNAGPTLCPFRLATGRPCPTCGLTRSWNSLAHLRLRDSVGFHPLGPLTFLAAAWLAVGGQVGQLPPAMRSAPVVSGLAGLWLGVWLRRLVAAQSSARSDRVPPQ